MVSRRRLAAIMFTDVVGFTASAQADESGTLARLRELNELVRPLLAPFGGREIKSTGDGSLIAFDSALKATECAVEIQQRLSGRGVGGSPSAMRLRVGIHVGDVEESEGDVFGDAVNVASRIVAIAEPGGICVSGAVHDHVRNKMSQRLERLPPTALKGVQTPIEIYRVILPWAGRGTIHGNAMSAGLAVLPFTNISPDPKDEYIADGLTEELITVLSQLRDLRVISRTSVMLYKATPKPASQIGAELGVSSLLEGSVRKAGNRLRITAQLIDVRTDRHLWAKAFDREFGDVFAVQTEIAKQVADALRLELQPAEEARLDSRATVRPESYLAYLRGLTLMRDTSQASLEAAQRQFEVAVSLDPSNAAAYGALAVCARYLGIWYTDLSRTEWVEKVRLSAARALELDPQLAEAHLGMAAVLFRDQDYAGMEREFKAALALNPSHALAHNEYANILNFVGRAEEALAEFRLAEAADPLWIYNLNDLVWSLMRLGRLDEALDTLEKVRGLGPPDANYHFALGEYYFARSETAKGLEEWRRSEALDPDGRSKLLTRAWSLVRAGATEEARTILRHEETLLLFGHYPTYVAQIYAELGDLDECFRWLDKSFAAHDLPIMLIRFDRRYENIRRDPRYRDLLAKMNLA